MIVVLAYTPNPTAIDTVEALCDATIRKDIKTQKTLMTLDEVPLPINKALNLIRASHSEVGKDYGAKIVKDWDDNAAAYCIIGVPLTNDEQILFKCRKMVNQWTVVSLSIDSPRK